MSDLPAIEWHWETTIRELRAENERLIAAVKALQEEIEEWRSTRDDTDRENERLRAALQGLIDGVVPEVNEKGAGGYLLARLTDARAALADQGKG